jgi:hypothetical protein
MENCSWEEKMVRRIRIKTHDKVLIFKFFKLEVYWLVKRRISSY